MRGKKGKHTAFELKVYEIAKRIPRGGVSTYAAVAKEAGRPGAARAVGNALNKNDFARVPCHRVVKSDGSAGGFARGVGNKKLALSKEGISLKGDKVRDFHKALYTFQTGNAG